MTPASDTGRSDDESAEHDVEQEPGPEPAPTVLDQIGGVSGLIYSTVPVVVFVPVNSFFGLTAAIIAALTAAANRKVQTTVIFPARNDDFAVGAASRSYYEELLTAGVRVFEYMPGLLHTKSVTIDGEVTLIGSANMDHRSFHLNFELSTVLYDECLSIELLEDFESFLSQSRRIGANGKTSWTTGQAITLGAARLISPLL